MADSLCFVAFFPLTPRPGGAQLKRITVMPPHGETVDNPERKKTPEGAVGMDGRLVAKKISRDGTEAIRVADDVRQSVAADLAADGKASYEITGSSRQNETGVVEVCALLAQRLRADGVPAGDPRPASGEERGIDCEIPRGDSILQVQVSRPATPQIWRTLVRSGSTFRDLEISAAVTDLQDIIDRKAAKTAPNDRTRIILAIDATETVVHAMDAVVRSFRSQRGRDLRAFGFAAVWVVGPERDSVHRLDINAGAA